MITSKKERLRNNLFPKRTIIDQYRHEMQFLTNPSESLWVYFLVNKDNGHDYLLDQRNLLNCGFKKTEKKNGIYYGDNGICSAQ